MMVGLCGGTAGYELRRLDAFRVAMGTWSCLWFKGWVAYHLDGPSLVSLMVVLLELVEADDARN